MATVPTRLNSVKAAEKINNTFKDIPVFKVNEVRKHEISGFRLIITTQISHTTEFIHSKSLSTSGQGKDCM